MKPYISVMRPMAIAGRQPSATSALVTVSVLLGALLLSLLFGLLLGTGNILVSGFLLGLVGVVLAVGAPRALFWASLVGSLVLAGLLELYVPGLQALRWAFAGSTALFLAAVLLQQFGVRSGTPPQPQPMLTWAMLAFIAVFALSLVANWRGGVNAVFAAKNYFQAWGLFLGLAMMPAWLGLHRTLPKVMLAIALLQLPFVLHQFFYLAPMRSAAGGLTAVDVVAGTFGASLAGGGNNAALAMFLVIVAAVLVSMWRTGALGGRWLWLTPLLLLPIFLNESKVSVVYLVLAFVIIFKREIIRRPLRFIGLSIAVAIIGAGLILSYAALHQGSRATTPGELVEHVIRQNTEEGERYGSLLLNRTSSITHWWEERERYSALHALIGHGPSESKLATGLLDEANNLGSRRYPGMGIGLTSISSVLWDFGVLGLVSLATIYLAAFVLAGRLARRHQASAYLGGLFLGLQAGVAILALSLLHKASFTFQLGYQVFTLLVLGFLVAAWRWPPVDAAGTKHAPHRHRTTPR